MNRRFILVCVLVLGVAAAFSGPGLGQASPNDVYRALSELSLVHRQEILQAFRVGFSQERLSPPRMLRLVTRLTAAQGEPKEKEGILLTIARALEDDLPVTLLVGKAEEGLARRVPLGIILNGSVGETRILGLVKREEILRAVRDLLYFKRIFTASGKGQTVATSLPQSRFDRIVTEVADVLCDYTEAGESPLDGHLIYEKVRLRLETLSQLKEPPILPEDAALVLRRITPGDLTSVLLKVLR